MCFCLIQYIGVSRMDLFNKLLFVGKYGKSYWQINSSRSALRTLFSIYVSICGPDVSQRHMQDGRWAMKSPGNEA